MPPGGPVDVPAAAAAARRTVQALVESGDLWEDFFDRVQIGLALADLSTRYLRCNASYAAVFGQLPEDLVGVAFRELVRIAEQPVSDGLVADLVSGRRASLETEQRYVGAGGRELWVLHGLSLVRTAEGEPQWFAVSAQDVTERRRVEQELRDLTAVLAERAVRDPLTGLANRILVEERLRGALARDARSGSSSGVLFLDLDDFKGVNDRYGHAVGDAVLQTFATRLTTCVRPSDTVARIGGDEFLVLAEGTTLAGLGPLVERLVAALDEPIEVGSLTLQVGVSVGLAVSTAGDADAAGLIEAADQAMYAAKRDGRSTL
ncbi:MAG TPA: diguanylate cyclase [Mycobacteriales bacterium]|nr:diguanylate cyclase [Mycobacteriales bacterium]